MSINDIILEEICISVDKTFQNHDDVYLQYHLKINELSPSYLKRRSELYKYL